MPGRVPDNPKVYHITHVDNLAGIVAAGGLSSDRRRLAGALTCHLVGMTSIKQRRLDHLEVSCHKRTYVGDYVPFYFCPRSIMLFILHRGNHPDITYTGGQGPMVHLESDLRSVVQWANQHGIRWAFTDRNAGAYITQFYDDLGELNQVNWDAVEATVFRDPVIKEGKQAEFLLYDFFPWSLVGRVGVLNDQTLKAVHRSLAGAAHRPAVSVEPTWYY